MKKKTTGKPTERIQPPKPPPIYRLVDPKYFPNASPQVKAIIKKITSS